MTSPFDSRDIPARTLIELLRHRAAHDGARQACVCLDDHGVDVRRSLTYAELDAEATSCAAVIADRVPTGSRVILMVPSGPDFIRGFFGCLYAGTIPVPVHPPRRSRSLERARHVLADAQPTAIVASADLLDRISEAWPDLSAPDGAGLDLIDVHQQGSGRSFSPACVSASDLALLQYTSGSTTEPKGVMVRHEDILRNQQMIQQAFRTSPDSVVVSWLPMQHDMGLIGTLLHPIYMGCLAVLMPPEAAMANPAVWLRAIATYRGTVSGGPNSAFDLCVDRIAADDRASVDLHSWTLAFNGSEPVRHATMDRFAKAFAACGFSRRSFVPCYGLAEATLMVSACSPGDEAPADRETTQAGDPPIVAAGTPASSTRIVIADPESRRSCGEAQVGEVWVSGDSIAAGYWNHPALTAETFQARLEDGRGPFLRTGDLGFVRGGTLYVTGRLKDLIILNGANYYPQDLEDTARDGHPTLRSAPAAAFAVERDGREGVAIVLELQPPHEAYADQLLTHVRQLVIDRHDVLPATIVLVKRGGVPRTTSGKVQRSACRRLLEAGALSIVARWDAEAPVAAAASATSVRDPVLGWLSAALAHQIGVDVSTITGAEVVSRLGLESMAALQVVQQIERHFGVVLPPTVLFGDVTLTDVADLIRARIDAVAAATTAATPAPDARHAASHGQRSLWLHAQQHPQATSYTIAHAVAVRGRLDAAAFRRAFTALLARHDALRTVFAEHEGQLTQVVRGPRTAGAVPLQEHDASAQSDAALRAELSARARQPFDLATGPLIRADLFRRGSGEHVLLLAVHHTIADLWSMAVLMRDLGVLYESDAASRRAELPPLSVQYADHVRGELTRLEADGERLWAFWRGQLAGDAPPLVLPTTGIASQGSTRPCGLRPFRLSAETSERVRAVAKTCGVTPYVVLLTAYVALLHRYSAQEDITVGSVVAGRDRADLADVVGYCANTVALRCALTGHPTFETLVPQIRRTVLQAFEHQAYPFPLIAERLHAEGRSDATPLFRTMFVYQSTVTDQASTLTALALGDVHEAVPWGGLEIAPLALDDRTSNYPLTLVMAARGRAYAGALEFHTDVFDPQTATGIVDHYQALLHAMLDEPGRPIAELNLLTDAQRVEVVERWNETAVDYGPTSSLHALIEEQARRTPTAIAVRSASNSLSYAALDHSANALARYLAARGAGPEAVVAIALERSCDLVVALLGVLKSGAAYMPIDRGYPADRIRTMLTDSACRLIVTDRQGADVLADDLAEAVCVDRDAAAIEACGPEPLSVSVHAANPAYVIYTSGSTGRPKGVVNTHAGIVNRLKWMQDYFQIGSEDRVLQKTPYTFDVSVWEFFWPLMTGACLVMADPGGHQDAHYLARVLETERITTVHFVPSMLRTILHESALTRAAQLKRVICSGEALPRSVQDECLTRHAVELYNLYGPTEAAVDVTAWRCQGDTTMSVPIGRPIANTRIYLLDRHLAPVPPGITGELYIAGVNLARGYLRRPALTAERFIADPVVPGERMYRTGDLARYRPDGAIEHLGRTDDQVKVRGARIELGEIQAVLEDSGLVSDAVAVARETLDGHQQIVAYVVPQLGVRPFDILQAAAQKLPPYMLPAVIVPLDALPIGPNGKLDKSRLPAPESMRPDLASLYVAPRDAVEEALAALWVEALAVRPIGVDDNFFELGGHSLLITQLVSSIRTRLGVKVPIRSFFDAPTIADLAEVVRRAEPDERDADGMSDLLAQLEHLTDDELEQRLVAETEHRSA